MTTIEENDVVRMIPYRYEDGLNPTAYVIGRIELREGIDDPGVVAIDRHIATLVHEAAYVDPASAATVPVQQGNETVMLRLISEVKGLANSKGFSVTRDVVFSATHSELSGQVGAEWTFTLDMTIAHEETAPVKLTLEAKAKDFDLSWKAVQRLSNMIEAKEWMDLVLRKMRGIAV